jgi:hypothetical protein
MIDIVALIFCFLVFYSLISRLPIWLFGKSTISKGEPQHAMSSESSEVIDSFERTLENAFRYHLANSKLLDLPRRRQVVNRLDLRAFVKIVSAKLSPREVQKVLFMALDFKLQVFTVLITDWDLYDRIVLSLSPHDTAHVVPGQMECQRIYAYSLDQGLIGKIRIVIERLMNMTYFIETGQVLHATARQSKKGKFKKWLATRPELAHLNENLNITRKFDEDLRTPEYHEGSVLRKLVLSGDLTVSLTIMERFVQMLNQIISTVVPRYFSIKPTA